MSMSTHRIVFLFLALAMMVAAGAQAAPAPLDLTGEEPVVRRHLDEGRIEDGTIRFPAVLRHGALLFSATFNLLDGRGRPFSTGTGAPRAVPGPDFIRTSAPDSSSCAGCHAQPRPGGGGDFVANVFVLAQALDPVTDSVGPAFSDERNTLGMMGSGAIEMLAREMSTELIAIREAARAAAARSGSPATRPLVAKGVQFGEITVLPDGRVDPSGIEGVDWDLIVKPFHQKGAVVSLREFTNNAMNHHHGMQAVERFGVGVDADGDGVRNELTVGDMTAVTLFQAALNVPGRRLPRNPAARRAVARGEAVFESVGCGGCHRPEFDLDSRTFSEPNPFNPPGNLRPEDVHGLVTFDMTRDGPKPRLERTPRGGAIVRAYTDLKRHDLNDDDYHHFDNEVLPQGTLNGFAPAADFTVPPEPRPTGAFLTRKLWDVGNSEPYGHRGDLSTMTEAIHYHGGDAREVRDAYFALPASDRAAVLAFLRTLLVVPDGTPLVAPIGSRGADGKRR